MKVRQPFQTGLGSLLALALMGSSAQAQMLLTETKHGMRVQISLQAQEERKEGTVVYVEPEQKYLLLRERPGSVPIKLQDADVKEIMLQDKGEPEIFRATEINGKLQTVRYFAPALSHAERAKLADLEAAENDAARKENLIAVQGQMVAQQFKDLAGAQRVLAAQEIELMNIYVNNLSWVSSYSPYIYPNPSGSTGAFQIGEFYAPRWIGAWAPGGFGLGAFAHPGVGGPLGAPARAAEVLERTVKMGKSLQDDLARARRTLASARVHACFENGELVAVLPE